MSPLNPPENWWFVRITLVINDVLFSIAAQHHYQIILPYKMHIDDFWARDPLSGVLIFVIVRIRILFLLIYLLLLWLRIVAHQHIPTVLRVRLIIWRAQRFHRLLRLNHFWVLQILPIFQILSNILAHDSILTVDYKYLTLVVWHESFTVPFVNFELGDLSFRNFLFEQIWVKGEKLAFIDIVNPYFRFLDHEYWEHVVVELSEYGVVILILGAGVVIIKVESIELKESSTVSPENLVRERKDTLACELLRG
mgnify:CR=1 FL=1